MISDLRFVLRALARNRGFTLVTVLTLALGIGSAASIFSVTDWILFRANKFPDDVYLIGGQTDGTTAMTTRMDFQARAYEEQKTVLASVGRAASQQGNIVVEGRPVGTMWMGVTGNIFSMLGITMRQGRGFCLKSRLKERITWSW
jgi:putative ABC transport system permease protein